MFFKRNRLRLSYLIVASSTRKQRQVPVCSKRRAGGQSNAWGSIAGKIRKGSDLHKPGSRQGWSASGAFSADLPNTHLLSNTPRAHIPAAIAGSSDHAASHNGGTASTGSTMCLGNRSPRTRQTCDHNCTAPCISCEGISCEAGRQVSACAWGRMFPSR